MSISNIEKHIERKLTDIHEQIESFSVDKKNEIETKIVKTSKLIEALKNSQSDLNNRLLYTKRFLEYKINQINDPKEFNFQTSVQLKITPIQKAVEKIFSFFITKIKVRIFNRYGSTLRQQKAIKLKEKVSLEISHLRDEIKKANKYLIRKAREYQEEVNEKGSVERNSQKAKLNKIKKIIKKFQGKIKRKQKLEKQIDKKLEAIKQKEAYLKKIDEKKKLAQENVDLLKSISGEPIKLTSSKKFSLDGMYFSAGKFREKLDESGAKKITLSKTVNGFTYQLNALSFDAKDWDENKSLLNTIYDFGLLEHSFGVVRWNDKVLLVRGSEIDKKNPLIIESDEDDSIDEIYKTLDDVELISETSLEKSSKGGTIILTFGNSGLYEDYGEDILIHLLQGMNVVTANPPGFGKSTGIPGKKSLEAYAETLYDFAKVRTGQKDEKILFKALCLSGGAAAFAAAKHPKTNIFLDQTYADLKNAVSDSVLYNKPKIIKALFTNIIGLFSPRLSVRRNLNKNLGAKAILYLENDSMISQSEVIKNVKAAFKSKKPNLTLICSPVGKHANGWYGLRYKIVENDNVSLYNIAFDLKELNEEWNELNNALEELSKEIESLNKEKKKFKVDSSKYKKIIKKQKKLKEEKAQKETKIKSLEVQINEITLKQAESLKKTEEQDILYNNKQAFLELNLVANQVEHFLEKANLIDSIIEQTGITQDELNTQLRKLEKYRKKIKKYKKLQKEKPSSVNEENLNFYQERISELKNYIQTKKINH